MKGRKLSQTILICICLAVYIGGLCNQYLAWNIGGYNPMMVSILGIFFSTLVLWLFVGVDWPSLLCLLGMALMPGIGFGTILPLSFGNSTFAFLLFTFILTYALEGTPIIKRITASALKSQWAQVSPWRLMLAFLCVVLLIGMVISPTILFMIVYPIFEELSEQLGWKRGNRNASILLFALYTTIAIGTAMTPINHVFAITAIGLYQEAFNQTISYWDYMRLSIPIGLAIFLGLLGFVGLIWKIDLGTVKDIKLKSLEDLPLIDKREKILLCVFLGVIGMWLFPEILGGLLPGLAGFFKANGIVFPPLLAVVFLSIIQVEDKPLINLSDAMKNGVHWPSLLLVSATLALGSILVKDEVGLVPALNSMMTPILSQLPAWSIVFIFAIWAGLQTNLSSNLVTVSVVSALAIALAQTSTTFEGISALIACFIGFMASMALMTPPAMPYVAISVGSGWMTSRQALGYGFCILILSIAACMLIGYPIGINIF